MELLDRLNAALRPRGRVFHGWWIVLAGIVLQVFGGALLMQSYGAYFVLLEADFGWSKTLLAGAFAMARIESGILGPLQGYMVDRFGPRAILRVGLVTFGVGFMLFSRIETLLGFYLAFFLLAVGSSLGGFVSITVSLVHWFSRHRAKAVALSQVGFALGGMAVPLVVISLGTFGWRATAFASGVIVIVVGLPFSQLVRHRPEPYGETPDGIDGEEPPPGVGRVASDRSEDFTAREAMRTPAFWLISLGHGSALLVVSAMMVHLVPYLTESRGYSLALAGWVVALMTATQLLGQLSGGWLGDRLDKRTIVVVCMVAHTAGLFGVAYATSVPGVLACVALHGWGWGTRGPLMVALRADYFGATSFGTIMGFSSLIVMLGMTAGPLVAGFVADRTGSYVPGFTALAAAALLGSLFFWFARRPAVPRSAARIPLEGSAAGR